MTDIIRDDLLQRLQELAHQKHRDINDVLEEMLADYGIEDDEDDAEWEAAFMNESLGDALLPDGSIDFEKLDAMTVPITLNHI